MTRQKVGDVLLHGSHTHEGIPNVCRVVRTDCAPSDGFLAVFVDPRNTRLKRMPCDRVFFVWNDSSAHEQMSPYVGTPDLVEHPPNQTVFF